ncbi:MAG: exonuclease SbcCD subunit D [Eubacteriales bacterium]|nr:exonuclease SbcCD subunit D [Eubacteriales bacterium]
MRLLHLSDLHLGKKLNEASLIDDQRHILAQILTVLDVQKPDAVLIAGDVYDKPIPSADAVKLLDEFLTQLAARELPVVIISGNHDSAERLAFGSRLLTAKNIFLSPAYDAENAIVRPVRLTDEYGSVNLWPVPFVKPAHVRAALPDAEISTYTDALRAVVAQMPLDVSERNVLVCHQFLTGGERCESEDIPVGGLDNVDASVFDAFDYVALGHLHRAQRVGRETVRYCGSPLKYSFSEVRDGKSVTLADFGPKGDVRLSAVPLSPKRELRELRGAYNDLVLKKNYEGTATDDYLHITLTDEDDVPDALSKLQVIYPNLLKLDYDNTRTRRNRLVELTDAPERRTPLSLLSDFYELQNNRPMTDAQQGYAAALMEKIWEERV